MDLQLFDYHLPKELIAQEPVSERDQCRLLVFNRKSGSIEHRVFREITNYLKAGDLLVLNDTKVIPARIFVQKPSGKKTEVFLLKEIEKNRFKCLVRGRVKKTINVTLKDGSRAVIHPSPFQEKEITFLSNIKGKLKEIGEVPLPPYIKRDYSNYDREKDFLYYQCVFAKKDGSVAAPTAGLHFTKILLKELKKKGIKIAYITLHVGIGTFQPVRESTVENHKMHSETFELSEGTAQAINETKESGGRVVAVGTTVVRTLETTANTDGRVKPASGETKLFIYPGFKYRIVDAMITNFHLPKSTLLMLVSAFCGLENMKKCYAEAIKHRYRFYSFGDAMFIY